MARGRKNFLRGASQLFIGVGEEGVSPIHGGLQYIPVSQYHFSQFVGSWWSSNKIKGTSQKKSVAKVV